MPVKRFTPSRVAIIIATAALVSVFQLSLYRRASPIVGGDEAQNCWFDAGLSGPIPQDSPRLIEWVMDKLVPPSKKSYNLNYYLSGLMEERNTSNPYSPSQEFILENFFTVFGENAYNPTPLFFIEAGAYDGEFLSNTLVPEKEDGWTGLLIEPNAKIFQKLLSKHRKAWSINCCLSTKPYPSQESFTELESTGKNSYIANERPGQERDTNNDMVKNIGKASSRLADHHNASDPDFRVVSEKKVQCLPLYSIARALNIHHVHFFSLDVEGAEMGILDTIPWKSLSFTMMAIEHTLGTVEDLTNFLEPKGYKLWTSQYPDYIFINSDRVKVMPINPHPNNKRKHYLGRKKLSR